MLTVNDDSGGDRDDGEARMVLVMSMESDSITALFPRLPLHQLSTEVSLRASLHRGEEACLSCKVVRQSLANPKSTRATCRQDTPFSEGYREDSKAHVSKPLGFRLLVYDFLLAADASEASPGSANRGEHRNRKHSRTPSLSPT